MSSLEAVLAYFRAELAQADAITRDSIKQLVDSSPLPLTNDQQSEIIRVLEASFDIQQTIGSTILGEHQPWLAQRRSGITFYYWNRLKHYYIGQNVLPLQVISVLDVVTDELLDFCGNPVDDTLWSRRGMVMGHVQSGKTTNYASLICKAADAGYKVIILLAGITNSLRSQTQERMDETFIGKKSIFQAKVLEQLSVTHYAEEKRFPAYGTSRDRDFSKAAAETWGVTLSALKEPIIFVTKKNKSTLENLYEWLRSENRGSQIHHPLLLIDDEADNASINTASDPSRVTIINSGIRRILSLFSRSTYIGYTATPFANIFIDPASADEMLRDDLFPRNFIKALDPPTNYCGARRIFSESGDLKSMVREINDHEDLLPMRHKKDLQPASLPRSLYQAINVFVLARALRILRGDRNRHASMVINVSRFNDVQERINGLVYGYLEDLRNSVLLGARISGGMSSDPQLRALQADFNSEYLRVEFDFDEVREVLPEAVGDIAVRTINMRGGELDYAKHKKEGLRVIAIGGLALSRGLTLEGLVVSYMLRNASACDTLMQMARWFGYRDGYEDLCRLYLPQASVDHYEYITEAIEELRAEVKSMSLLGMSPERFGLKVRQSPAAIRITAANKMRNATELTVAQDYSGRHIEGYALPTDLDENKSNLQHVLEFVRGLGRAEEQLPQSLIWRRVPAASVVDLVSRFRFAPTHPDLGPIQGDRSLFLHYVEDRIGDECAHWDVVLPFLGELRNQEPVFAEVPYEFRTRGAGVIKDQTFKITRKNKAANPLDEMLSLSKEQWMRAQERAQESDGKLSIASACCMELSSPVLLLHLFKISNENDESVNEWCSAVGKTVATLSFCMPKTRVAAKERTYQVNKVYREQLALALSEPDDDDAPILDELSGI